MVPRQRASRRRLVKASTFVEVFDILSLLLALLVRTVAAALNISLKVAVLRYRGNVRRIEAKTLFRWSLRGRWGCSRGLLDEV